MKDLKGKLIWICKGDFKEPNASCQPHITMRAAGTAGFPMCQTHVPGGLQHGHFPSLVATTSWETVIPFCCSIFWGGVTAIQGSFSKDNNNSLPVFQLQLTKACKRFTGEKCCQSTKVLVLFTKKKQVYIYHI